MDKPHLTFRILSRLNLLLSPSDLPLRSANKALLYFPQSRLKFKGDRAFAVAAPRLWNQLPPDIKSAPSISVFKSRLKTHLYSMAFPEF